MSLVPSYKSEWEKYFPGLKKGEYEPRKEQEEAIDEIIHHYKSGKRFVVCDIGTGVGKSNIGVTISRWMENNFPVDYEAGINPGSNILTSQKILQDQYMKDFAKIGMKSIKSASNYTCSYEPRESCGEAHKLHELNDPGFQKWKAACNGLNCRYRSEKVEFIESPLSVTSYAYYIYDVAFAKQIKKKQLLVLDEAHLLEKELFNFVEFSIAENFCRGELGIKFPDYKTFCEKFKKWIFEDYREVLIKECEKKRELAKQLKKVADKNSTAREILDKIEHMQSQMSKMTNFIDSYNKNPDNWVEYIEESSYKGQTNRIIKFKPIDIAEFCEPLIYKKGQYVLSMSATIINLEGYCGTAGLKHQNEIGNVGYVKKESPFPAKNRKTFFMPAGEMSADKIDQTLPHLAKQVETILDLHENEKGIIHVHNYKIASYLVANLKSKRILTHSSSNRDAILKQHIESKTPTVLLSPSMAEGVDLKDDLSRFQVICKIPFPYLGDRQIKRKMAIDKNWYSYETAKTIIQSIGRSIRNEKDYAITYILDGSWSYFYYKNSNLFPEKFKEAYFDLSK